MYMKHSEAQSNPGPFVKTALALCISTHPPGRLRQGPFGCELFSSLMVVGSKRHLRPLMLHLNGMMHQLEPLSAHHCGKVEGCCSKECGVVSSVPSATVSRQLNSLTRTYFATYLHGGREGCKLPAATCLNMWIDCLRDWALWRIKVNFFLVKLPRLVLKCNVRTWGPPHLHLLLVDNDRSPRFLAL